MRFRVPLVYLAQACSTFPFFVWKWTDCPQWPIEMKYLLTWCNQTVVRHCLPWGPGPDSGSGTVLPKKLQRADCPREKLLDCPVKSCTLFTVYPSPHPMKMKLFLPNLWDAGRSYSQSICSSPMVLGIKSLLAEIQTGFCISLRNCGVGEDSWESLGLQGDPTSPS